MAHQLPLFHSLLRPCVLQILRAQGYHAARASVIDALTDLAARYLTLLCESTAHHTAHNSTELTGLVPSLVDVRLALEDCGALAGGDDSGDDDPRGVDEFVDWVAGPRNREIRRVALDGDDENSDYLSILKKKHSKTGEDSKYSSTVLGRGNVGDHHSYGGGGNGDPSAGANGGVGSGDIVVEGGDYPSIASWQEKRIEARQRPRPPTPQPDEDEDEEMDDEYQQEEDAGDGGDGDGAKANGDGESRDENKVENKPENGNEDVNDNENDDAKADRHRKSRSPSSGLSSLGDRSIDEEMELEFAVKEPAVL